jgi:hypothetical protein
MAASAAQVSPSNNTTGTTGTSGYDDSTVQPQDQQGQLQPPVQAPRAGSGRSHSGSGSS